MRAIEVGDLERARREREQRIGQRREVRSKAGGGVALGQRHRVVEPDREAGDAVERAEVVAVAGEAGGVMHCFTEAWEVADAAMNLGFHISFSGIVSFKNATALHDVARRVPLERMLIETDSPYLAPVPYRGKTNEPAYVVHVAEAIAKLRGIDVAEVARATSANFFGLFRIDPHAP